MLKNFGYDGVYNDENISVSVLLENPIDWNFEETNLVFSIALRGKKESAVAIKLEDFNFYIMDETNHLHNTRSVSRPKRIIEIIDDEEPIRQPDGLILAEFKPGFLFQDLRIAFYYQPYRRILLITLKR